MARHPFQIQSQDQGGNIIVGASVILSLTGTSTAIICYDESSGGSAVTDAKFTTDSDGRVKAWVEASDYSSDTYFRATLSGSRFVTQIIDDISIIPISDVTIATRELDNLTGVAINTSLVSDTHNTDDLGTEAIAWKKLYLGDGGISFEGSTDDGFQTTLNVTDPTGDRAITIQNATGTIVLKDTTDTLENKTLITPTIASFANATHDHADAAGGSNDIAGRWELLSTATASSSSSIDFPNDFTANYDLYMLTIDHLVPATDNLILHLRVSNDGSTFEMDAGDYAWLVGFSTVGDVGETNSASDAWIDLTVTMGFSTNEDYSGIVYFINPLEASKTVIQSHGSYANINTVYVVTDTMARTLVAESVTGFQLVMSSDEIASGVFNLYGLRN
jgi:hypothetical protein